MIAQAMDYSKTYKVALAPALQAKIPAGDPRWHSFNGSFVNSELDQLTLADKVYSGHPVTTWLKPSWRKSENYQLGQHLGLDFDTCDKRSTIKQLLSDPFIQRYAFIVYTTPSHTPDAPRARVFFLLDTPIHQAKNYVMAATALLWIFGNADRQCKDPVRFFYGGRPGACELEWPGQELPLAVVKDLIRRYRASGAHTRRHVHRKYNPTGTNEKEVMSALGKIPPWSIDYDQWLAVLMAIHSEFPGENGLHMAESWAQGYEGEVAHKWRSFRSDGNVTGRVGIGTLFAFAKEQACEH